MFSGPTNPDVVATDSKVVNLDFEEDDEAYYKEISQPEKYKSAYLHTNHRMIICVYSLLNVTKDNVIQPKRSRAAELIFGDSREKRLN